MREHVAHVQRAWVPGNASILDRRVVVPRASAPARHGHDLAEIVSRKLECLDEPWMQLERAAVRAAELVLVEILGELDHLAFSS
jgi:hypothetical protein